MNSFILLLLYRQLGLPYGSLQNTGQWSC